MKPLACCLALTLALLTGCVSLSPDEIAVRTHYRIDLDPGPMGGAGSDMTIGVRPFSQSGSLDREGIRYQTSDVEGGYFSTHLWAEPVATMVQSVVYEDLDAAQIFSRVLLLENVGSADLYVDAQVHRFGEEDGPNGWTGVVEITFEVTAAATGEVVFHRRLKATEAASEPTVKETVRGISRALSGILGELRSALVADFGRAR